MTTESAGIQVDTEELQFRDGSTPNLSLTFFTRNGLFTKPNPNVLLWIHGIGEYSERYTRIVEELFNRVPALDGIASYDQRGHGKSGGRRGVARDVDELVEDFVERVSPRLALEFGQNANIIVGGQSLGGLIAAVGTANPDWLEMDDLGKIKGVLLTSPAIEPVVNGAINKVLAFLSVGLLAIPGVAWLSKSNGIEGGALTHDQEEIDKVENDDLMHDNMGLGLGGSILKRGKRLLDKIDEGDVIYKMPLLILHGDEDSICAIAGSQKLADKANGKLEVIKGALHEVHFEEKGMREIALGKISEFLTETFGAEAVGKEDKDA